MHRLHLVAGVYLDGRHGPPSTVGSKARGRADGSACGPPAKGERDPGGKKISKAGRQTSQLETYLVAIKRDGAIEVLHQKTYIADRDLATSSAMGRHDVFTPARIPLGHRRGYGLDLSVEANPFHAMHVVVAKQRALPSAKTVKRHGHRDRNIDADHPDLHLVGERARRVAVTGEETDPVAEFVIVDQVKCVLEAGTRMTLSTGPKISSR